MSEWKPTYDKHRSREAAVKDAARRTRQSVKNRRFRVVGPKSDAKGDYWLVEYED